MQSVAGSWRKSNVGVHTANFKLFKRKNLVAINEYPYFLAGYYKGEFASAAKGFKASKNYRALILNVI